MYSPHTRAIASDLFKELHERVEASPDMIKFATKLAYVWYSNVPEKVLIAHPAHNTQDSSL